MTEIRLSFKDWPYPTKHPRTLCCAIGECGFLATAVGKCVSIYSNEIGQFSPMFMWSPFEHNVTAMGWYNGSCTPSVVQPIIAIASNVGSIAVYDIRSRDALGKIKLKGESISSVVWNPFYRSRFYAGTQSGRFVCCQIVENNSDSQESGKDSTIVIQNELKFNFSIDYISIDPQTGTTIAVASKKEGKFSVINNITTITNKSEFEAYILPGKNLSITSLSFFPGQVSFLIISTLQKAVLFSIRQKITIPLISADDIRFISMQTYANNGIIIGSSNSVTLWKFMSNDNLINSANDNDNLEYFWNKVSQITFNTIKSNVPEAAMYCELEGKVVVINSSNWITEIEEKRNKLFITQRARLMPSKPLDWDFRKGSIGFCTSSGQVLITSWTPDSIIQRQKNNDKQENNETSQTADLSPIANENDDEKKRKQQQHEHYLMKEQRYRRQQMFGHNYNNRKNSTDSTEDGEEANSASGFDSNLPLSDDIESKSNSRPTFSMLMDQGDDDVEFEVDSDNFEKRDNLDFSSNFVSMQANNVLKNARINRPGQKRVKLSNYGSSDSINDIPATSLLSLDQEENSDNSHLHLNNSPISNENYSNNSSGEIDLNNTNDKNIEYSLKLPQEVSLDNNQQHEFFLHASDMASVGSISHNLSFTSHDLEQLSSSEVSVTGSSENNNALTTQLKHHECGNSLKLLLSFKVADYPLNHLMWAPGGRLIVWSFYNEKNILQLVDFKRRKVTPLLKVQLNAIHVPITNLFFSKDRSMFCVLIGNQTAVFMTTSAHPTQIGTLNFKHPVIGSFDPTGKRAVFVRKDGYIYYASINYEEQVIVVTSKCKNKYLYHEKRGEPTYVIWRTIGILIGTSTGNVILLDSKYTDQNSIKEKNTDFKQIASIENSKILYITPVTKGCFLILDDKQTAYLAKDNNNGTNQLTCLKKNIKKIKAASKDTFLCRIAGNGKLSVLSSNAVFSPLLPPCVSRCPLMLDEDQYMSQLLHLKLKTPEEAMKACRLFGAIFIMRLIRSKINKFVLQNQTMLLYQILSNCKDFSSVAFRLALKIGNREVARKMLLQTSPSDPNYLNNMSRAALFDVQEMGESTNQVVENLFQNGKISEASDLLMIIGDIFTLVNKYLEFHMPREAAMLLRTRKGDDEYYSRQRKVAHEVATNLISNKHLLLGLKMLMENDYHDQVSKIVSGIFGDEMAHFLSFLKVSADKKH